MKKRKIGIIGFGTVGQGLYHYLSGPEAFDVEVAAVVIKNPAKKREIEGLNYTTDVRTLLDDPEVELIVEATDDAETAFQIALESLLGGKHFVTANKKMLAHNLPHLVSVQRASGKQLRYEASVAASIPVVQTLDRYFSGQALHTVKGILNGTSNFILSRMGTQQLDYATALQQAKEAGFAESDPTLDVDGWDAFYKVHILATHASGQAFPLSKHKPLGISRLAPQDFLFASQYGLRIKPLAVALLGERPHIWTAPALVSTTSPFYQISEEYNAIELETQTIGKQFYVGKGAGKLPTGYAIYQDVIDCLYGERLNGHLPKKKAVQHTEEQKPQVVIARLPAQFPLKRVASEFEPIGKVGNWQYIRFQVQPYLLDATAQVVSEAYGQFFLTDGIETKPLSQDATFPFFRLSEEALQPVGRRN